MIATDKKEYNKEKIIRLLRDTKRTGIDDLVEWMIGTDFFEAPASTRLDFHGCHEGGLADHSLNVYEAFTDKVEIYGLDIRDDEATIASICHDFCKIDIYVPNVLKGGQVSVPMPYVKKEDFPFGHGDKSVLVASKHIDMTKNEALMIRWHMGRYDGEWDTYKSKVERICPAVIAFQYADDEASKFMDYRVR
ncbi:metal-dependent phosphohydrolase [Nanoarchaeota archaeon]